MFPSMDNDVSSSAGFLKGLMTVSLSLFAP